MNTEIYNHIFQGESYSRGQRTSLYMLPLRDFLYMYGEELFNYYGEDFYVRSDEESWLNDGKIDADTMILCMVDLGDDNSFITKKGVEEKEQETEEIDMLSDLDDEQFEAELELSL